MKCRFVVSIDTEEDIWGWASTAPVTCGNVKELPRLARFFRRLQVRPTFFVTYRVMSDPSARAVLRELAAEDWIEMGCHVHPWNTPPLDDSPRRTMLHNLPRGVQAAKIGTATETFGEVFGHTPTSFRAGRFGFGRVTADCLIAQGYRVDSSVTPFFDWTGSSDGQDYTSAPLDIYGLDPEHGLFDDSPRARLIEVPLTSGYTRMRPRHWEAVARFLNHRAVRVTHIGGIGSLALGFRKTILSPESHTIEDLTALGTRVVESGVGHLHMFFHSSSLVPGLTPFSRTPEEVARLFGRIEEVLNRFSHACDLDFVSVGEAAGTWGPRAMEEHTQGRETVRIAGAEESHPPVAAPTPSRWFRPRRVRARLRSLGRYVYWRLGGYRHFRRVRWSDVKRLVFVCTGNICRSPYAEHRARSHGLDAVSFGVNTTAGNGVDPMALQVGRERGVRMEDHRTTRLEDFQPTEGDLFVAMEPFQADRVSAQKWAVPHQVTLLGMWAGSNGPVIPDPYGGSEDSFAHCFSVVDHGIYAIKSRLEAGRPVDRSRGRMASSHSAS